jgi:thioesterase domain-containing protein
MLAVELEKYIQDHIPLSKAMQVSVVEIQDETVVLSAPLEPNINHHQTVFGGSASALGMLSAWSLLKVRLSNIGLISRLVISKSSMDFILPIQGDFRARAVLTQPEEWGKFVQTLIRREKARIMVSVIIEQANQVVGRLTGEFVALRA